MILVIVLSSGFGFSAGLVSSIYLFPREFPLGQQTIFNIPQISQEKTIINTVNRASQAVVSIIITKDLPVFEKLYIGPFEIEIPEVQDVEKREIGGGTGFLVSEDGLILTNAHVVADKEADYTVLTNDGKKYKAKVLGRDTLRDLAVVKISDSKKFPILRLGDSDKLQIGQTVAAIGNALGEFRNTVSVGVISGLRRTVTAQGGGQTLTLRNVIQTDAAINRGNSGGPLLNLKGEVIGVNFAIAESAQNIGFAIPVSLAKKTIEQVKSRGKIVYPFLGVRYAILEQGGVLIQKGKKGESAIFSGSAAQIAGLKEGDIILEFNGEKIVPENPLADIIMKYNPGDKVTLKIKRNGKEFNVKLVLGEREGG